MRFVVAETFTRSLGQLDPVSQNQVKQKAFEFQMDPSIPGLRFHQLNGARDRRFWSFRVNDDLRVIVHRDGDSNVLCHVDRHDRAYAWGESRRLDAHPDTGVLQIVQVVETVQETVRRVLREVEEDRPVLARFDPVYLRALGVPAEWLDAVRVVGQDGLLKLMEHLPPEVAERLMLLASGEPVPLPAPAATSDALQHPDSLRAFHVVDGQDDLRRALDTGWAGWTVFLHPSQRALVERVFRGPARVTGGAGTGKTVVAIHRAARLLARSPDARVLLTSYSRTLASRIQRQVATIAPAASLTRLRVENVHRLATRVLTQRGLPRPVIIDSRRLSTLCNDVASAVQGTDPRFLRDEFELVVDPWGIRTVDEYLRVARHGRGAALRAGARKASWVAIEELLRRMGTAGLTTWSGLCHAARAAVVDEPFDHVIVDEAQDLGPAELMLIRRLARPGSDDLFLCSDAGQRIYRTAFPWTAAGVDVRGRGARLRLNYRTTEQIRAFADQLMPDELDEGEGEFQRRSAVSLLTGPVPDLRACSGPDDEIRELSRWVADAMRSGIKAAEIGVFARTDAVLRDRVRPALGSAGVVARELSDDEDGADEGVAIGTMHRAKGLEFRAVAVVGCDALLVPLATALASAPDEESRRAAEVQERQLLYVALTRARERLHVSWAGSPSRFLQTCRVPTPGS